MPNFAIFGGTFNPVHWGHLLIAETAFDQFQLDRVIWVPTFRTPHKAQPLVAFEHRLEMVCRAIADHPAFTVSAVEAQQQGSSYAIATLRALQTLEPDACWYWLIGNDAFQSLPKWKGGKELAAQCIWLVAPRTLVNGEVGEVREAKGAGEALPTLIPHASRFMPHASLRWHLLEMPGVTISSSLIRQRCRDGRSIRYLVPEAVRHYMIEQVLYQMS